MLKRVMALVLSLCIAVSLFTAVSANEPAKSGTGETGGGLVSSSFTDDFSTLDKAYSVTNFIQQDAVKQGNTVANAKLDGNTAEPKTIKTLIMQNHENKAEIVYRAAKGKLFSGIDVNFWRQDGVKFPEISYSYDGNEWTTLIAATAGAEWGNDDFWSLPQSPDTANNWIAVHNNKVKSIPGAQFIKITFPEYTVGYDDKRVNARIIDVSVTVAGLVSSSFTDDFTTIDNTYSTTNFEQKSAIRQKRRNTNGDVRDVISESINETTVEGSAQNINTLAIKKYDEAAEVVYRAADDRLLTGIGVNIWRQDQIKSPEISYSNDGINWETIVTAPIEKGWLSKDANYGWTPTQDGGNSENDWVGIHNINKEVPQARFVKVKFPENSGRARIVDISVTVAGLISESMTDDFSTLDNAYTVKNFERVNALRYPNGNDKNGIVVSKPLTDKGESKTIQTLIMKDHTKSAELIYHTTEGKEFTGIDINFMRDGESVKFPGISYSDDGEEWTEFIAATSIKQDDVAGVWTKAQDGRNYGWTFRYTNNNKTIPGVRFIKITFPEYTVGYDNKRPNARIIDLTLTVDNAAYTNTLAVTANGTAALTDADESVNGAKLFIAEYNADNVLINAAVYTVAAVNHSFERTLEKSAEGAYFKAFLFGGESGTKPITAAASSKTE